MTKPTKSKAKKWTGRAVDKRQDELRFLKQLVHETVATKKKYVADQGCPLLGRTQGFIVGHSGATADSLTAMWRDVLERTIVESAEVYEYGDMVTVEGFGKKFSYKTQVRQQLRSSRSRVTPFMEEEDNMQ